MRYFGFILAALLAFTLYSTVSAGYCTGYKSYDTTCSKTVPYTVKCGSYSRMCTKYRYKYYKCSVTRPIRVCCPGYRGTACETRITG